MSKVMDQLMTQADLKHMIDWLEQQDGSAIYVAGNTRDCLLAQYLKASGFPITYVTYSYFHTHDEQGDLTGIVPKLANTIAMTKPYTYGAALARARHELTQLEYGIKPSEDPDANDPAGIPEHIQAFANKSGVGICVNPLELNEMALSIAVNTGRISKAEADELRIWLRDFGQ